MITQGISAFQKPQLGNQLICSLYSPQLRQSWLIYMMGLPKFFSYFRKMQTPVRMFLGISQRWSTKTHQGLIFRYFLWSFEVKIMMLLVTRLLLWPVKLQAKQLFIFWSCLKPFPSDLSCQFLVIIFLDSYVINI